MGDLEDSKPVMLAHLLQPAIPPGPARAKVKSFATAAEVLAASEQRAKRWASLGSSYLAYTAALPAPQHIEMFHSNASGFVL